MSAPFGDDLRGDCNAFLSILARSLRREGWERTGGIPLLNVQKSETEAFYYYPNHTPGVPWVTAAAFAVCGDSEQTSRAVALVFSLLTTALLIVLCGRKLGRVGAGCAWLALSLLPAGWYWGTHLNYEVPAMPFATLFLILACRDDVRWRLAAIALIVGFFFDLVTLFAVAAMIPVWLLRSTPRWRTAATWMLVGAALVVGWWCWQQWQLDRYGHADSVGAREHLYNVSLFSPELELGAWLRAIPGNMAAMIGWGPMLVWLYELVRAHREQADDSLGRLLRASSWLAILAIVIPAQRSFDHPYYALYFQIPIAIAVARMADRFWRWKPGGRRSALCVALSAMIVITGVHAEFTRPEAHPDRPRHTVWRRSSTIMRPIPGCSSSCHRARASTTSPWRITRADPSQHSPPTTPTRWDIESGC